MNILITGVAGFIGFHCVKKLLNTKNNYNLIGVDNLNNYYDAQLKKDRLKILKQFPKFNFYKLDICDNKRIEKLFKKHKIHIVINLAASAGVRYSLTNPEPYFNNNISGFFNILNLCVKYKINHLLFASSSSVYGNSNKFPLKEDDETSKPLSFYAASKKCNEVMAYSYSNIYNLSCTGLRFFTVYGEFGRPDMALFKFSNNIMLNKKIELFNKGKHVRDFTYINDVVDQIYKLIKKPSKKNIPYQIYNIASSNPVSLKQFVQFIESALKKRGRYKLLKMQPGDVEKTFASTDKVKYVTKLNNVSNLKKGIDSYIKWFKKYYFKQ